MVLGEEAREDVECLLTKELLYRRQTDEIVDYSTNETKRDFEEIRVNAQVTLQNFTKDTQPIGSILKGTLVAFMRYEYCKDNNGQVLKPKLTPSRNDEIIFLERKFVVKDVTPATSEDEVIIGWDVRAEEN